MLVIAPWLMFSGVLPFVVFGTDTSVFDTFSAREVFVRPADVVLVLFWRVVRSCCRVLKVSLCFVNTPCI